ncbi:MAG: hypothetical protein D6805_05505 [Planctomycetota bacterium]|nr:MAG: hypothetical protein D6805_05505 [Planctomycetota bacterium]
MQKISSKSLRWGLLSINSILVTILYASIWFTYYAEKEETLRLEPLKEEEFIAAQQQDNTNNLYKFNIIRQAFAIPFRQPSWQTYRPPLKRPSRPTSPPTATSLSVEVLFYNPQQPHLSRFTAKWNGRTVYFKMKEKNQTPFIAKSIRRQIGQKKNGRVEVIYHIVLLQNAKLIHGKLQGGREVKLTYRSYETQP